MIVKITVNLTGCKIRIFHTDSIKLIPWVSVILKINSMPIYNKKLPAF